MKSFTAVAAVCALLVLAGVSVGRAQNTLPSINVTANPCQYPVTCIYGPGMSMGLFPAAPQFIPPLADRIPADYGSLIATCKSLRDRASQMGCDTNNPPPVPGISSPTQGAWVSNGCGDGSWKSKIGKFIVGVANLDEPLPGFSFRPACVDHDKCYHVGFKSFCDLKFGGKLAEICVTSNACGEIAAKYEDAVHHFGQSAYNSDQWDMECAKISKDLRDGNCAS